MIKDADRKKVVSSVSGKLVAAYQLERHEKSYLKNLKNCPVCNKTHVQRMFCSRSCAAKVQMSRLHDEAIRRKLKTCIQCGKLHINLQFCSKSCSAKYSNTANPRPKLNQGKRKDLRPRPYTCAKTGIIFMSSVYRKYHPSIINDKQDYYRACIFRFHVYKYPKWFDLKIIEEYGWFSNGGRYRKKETINMGGISRDHMFSIYDGFRLGIDPALLSHPANCCLMIHNKNIRKHRKSVITIEQLIQRIKDFEEIYSTSEEIRTP